ncbi:MAG: TolC family protein [Methylophilaceae bacterium]
MRLFTVFTCLMLAFNIATVPAYGADLESTTDSLTLQDALTLALNANPELAVLTREREAIEGAQLQAAARPNPSISALVEDTRNATRQTTIQIEQTIELGSKREARMSAADIRLEAATIDLAIKKAEILGAVKSAFYEALAAQERVRLSESSLLLAQQTRETAAKRVKAGKISPIEETKSRVTESGARIESKQAASTLVAAKKHLAALWGNANPRFLSVIGQLDVLPPIPSLAQLSEHLEEAPIIRRAKLEITHREALSQIEESRRTPDVTVSLGARRNEELGLNQAIFGISVPIPLFDRNQGNLQEAISRAYKAGDELVAVRISNATDLSAAHENLVNASQEANSLQVEILPDAQNAYEATIKGFEFGKFDFINVLDAQRVLSQAKSQRLNALLSAHQALADIERILGIDATHLASGAMK